MKLYQTIGLTTAGIAWLATVATAQRVTTNSTAVPNTVSTPTFQPDTLRPSREQILNDNTAGQDDADRKNRRERRRELRRSNRSTENNRMNRTPSSQNTSPQDGAYRQGSTSNGTTTNNSNNTNYNSANVMTAPTGVGSNPSATGAAGDVRPGTVSAGSTSPSSGSSASTSPNLNRPAATGTGKAVAGADNAPVVNTSVSTGKTTVGDFVASQPDYTTLQNAIQSADLIDVLRGGQAYTVFAPSNAAFKKIPTKTQNVLLDGQNRDALKKLLSYHVVLGSIDSKELMKQINAGNGKATLKTLSGATLTATTGTNGRVTITDERGNTASIDTPDKTQANGVVHGIDSVLMPKSADVTFR